MLLLLLLIAGGPQFAQAGRDKDATPSPTVSHEPSPGPTTEAPSPWPTISPKPTAAHSEHPTVAPSSSFPPSLEPTLPRTIVPMPEMRFVMQTTGPLDDEPTLRKAMVGFLNRFLNQGFYRNAFRGVTLDMVLQNAAARRELQEGGGGTVVVDVVNGMAIYEIGTGTPLPTEEELYTILSAYFSLWGAQNLQEYLRDMHGLPVQKVSQVAFDGVVLPSTTNNEDRSTENGGGEDNNDKNKYIIAGTVVGALAVFVAVFFIVRQRRGKKSAGPPPPEQKRGADLIEPTEKDLENNHSNNNDDNNNKGNSCQRSVASASADGNSTIEAPPPPPPVPAISSIPDAYSEKMANPYAYQSIAAVTTAPTILSPDDDDDDDDSQDTGNYTSDGDIISVTESLHHQIPEGPLFKNSHNPSSLPYEPAPEEEGPVALTGKASVRVAAPTSQFKYDDTRLDQVISSTKGQQQQQVNP